MYLFLTIISKQLTISTAFNACLKLHNIFLKQGEETVGTQTVFENNGFRGHALTLARSLFMNTTEVDWGKKVKSYSSQQCCKSLYMYTFFNSTNSKEGFKVKRS